MGPAALERRTWQGVTLVRDSTDRAGATLSITPAT
jgi:hypothetical protein